MSANAESHPALLRFAHNGPRMALRGPLARWSVAAGRGIAFQKTYRRWDLTPAVVALQVDAAGARPPTVKSRWTKVASASRPPPWGAGVAVVDNSGHGIACAETVTLLTSVPTTLLPSLACYRVAGAPPEGNRAPVCGFARTRPLGGRATIASQDL